MSNNKKDRAVVKRTVNTNMTIEEDETYEEALARYGLSPAKNGHYVDKAELYQHMVAYREARDKAKAEARKSRRLTTTLRNQSLRLPTTFPISQTFRVIPIVPIL